MDRAKLGVKKKSNGRMQASNLKCTSVLEAEELPSVPETARLAAVCTQELAGGTSKAWL